MHTSANKPFAAPDAVLAAYRNLSKLVADAALVPVWNPDGKSFAFLAGPADKRQAWRVDLATGEKTRLVDPARLREALKAATDLTPPGQGIPFEHFVFLTPTRIAFALGTDRLTLDLDTLRATLQPPPSPIDTFLGFSPEARTTPRPFKRSMPLVDPADAYEIPSPDGKWLLSIQAHNVSLRATYDGRAIALTEDGSPEVEWNFDWTNPMFAILGLASPTTNWSPQSTRIAAYKVDNRGVARLPQPHWLKPREEVVWRYHAKAGGVLERHSLYVLDVSGRPPVEIQLGETRDTYPVFAGWLPDGSELLVFQMARDCKRARVLAANPETGAVRELFEEASATFVRIHHDIYFGRKLGLTLTADGKHILWLSERDGWKHLYQYDLDGQLVAQLTSGRWTVESVVRVSSGHVYFTAHSDPDRPYDLHLCRVSLGGGPLQQLTQGAGIHNAVLSPDGAVFIDTCSSVTSLPRMELRSADGKLLSSKLLQADASRLRELDFADAEEFSVKAADGETDLWGVLYKPSGFDPSKKYPLIEYIYGGPQLAICDHAHPAVSAMGHRQLVLAQQLGCPVAVLDARGTPGRSKAFHDAAYGTFCGVLTQDHAAAIRALAQRFSFIDPTRVGIVGGSWGAYSAFRCLAEQPDVYKAAVCLAPGFDPYSSILYECYLGTPQGNPAGYRTAEVFPLAATLQGEVLIGGGTSDHATWPDLMKMDEALIRAGKAHEIIVLPEQYHGWDSVHGEYLDRKQAAFLQRALGF